jgi:uncharacterized protein (TIGR03382 family)
VRVLCTDAQVNAAHAWQLLHTAQVELQQQLTSQVAAVKLTQPAALVLRLQLRQLLLLLLLLLLLGRCCSCSNCTSILAFLLLRLLWLLRRRFGCCCCRCYCCCAATACLQGRGGDVTIKTV